MARRLDKYYASVLLQQREENKIAVFVSFLVFHGVLDVVQFLL